MPSLKKTKLISLYQTFVPQYISILITMYFVIAVTDKNKTVSNNLSNKYNGSLKIVHYEKKNLKIQRITAYCPIT